MDGYGALAAMGGIFTTVEDLATLGRRLPGRLPAARRPGRPAPAHARDAPRDAAADGPDAGIRLSATSSPDAMPDARGRALRLRPVHRRRRPVRPDHRPQRRLPGLRLEHALAPGVRASGSSRSRTTATAPASLARARHARASCCAPRPRPLRRTRPNAATLEAARDASKRLSSAGTTTLAAAPVRDERRARRAARAPEGVDRAGSASGTAELRRDDAEPVESITSHHLVWWLAGDRGRVRVELLLSPELPPRVQTFGAHLRARASGSSCGSAAERIVAALDAARDRAGLDRLAGRTWSSRHVTDIGRRRRARMRATEARFAPLTLGPVDRRRRREEGNVPARWAARARRPRPDARRRGRLRQFGRARSGQADSARHRLRPARRRPLSADALDASTNVKRTVAEHELGNEQARA